MRRVVYADSLILLNTVVTFLLLLSVRAASSVNTTNGRLIAASFIGGAASLLALLPAAPFYLTFLIKPAIAMGISFTAFFIRDMRKLLRCFALFQILTFACGGFFLFFAQRFPGIFLYRNGFGYFNLPFWSVLLITSLAYGAVLVIRKKLWSGKETYRYSIEVTYGGKTAQGTALLDSGHNVTDCYTGLPVVIAKKSLLRQLLSEQIGKRVFLENYLADKDCSCQQEIYNSDLPFNNLRIIKKNSRQSENNYCDCKKNLHS